VRQRLIGTLFGGLPVFFGGVVATIVGPFAVAIHRPSPWLIAWLIMEAVIAAVRSVILVHGLKAAKSGQNTQTDLAIVFSLGWAAGLGFGCFATIASGDWMIATIACVPAAAMMGGLCFRNFAAPRMVTVMMALSLGPMGVAAILTGEPIMTTVAVLVPLFLVSMATAAFRMNEMFVAVLVAEMENRHRAFHDDLTGLCNRAFLVSQLTERLTRAKGDGVAVFYLDLDGFKAVNDSHGHATGDRLLQLVADRINAAVRPGDITARLGGDEFCVVADRLDGDEALALGQRISDRITRVYDINGKACPIGVSIGIALAPAHGLTAGALLAAADGALYVAKGRSICSVVLADDEAASPDLAPLDIPGLAEVTPTQPVSA
jgi:diguanylate cyclase (GGDEF)-like protein